MTATLFVHFKQEGWHRWPAATPHRLYLSNKHRHLFHVNVTVDGRVDGERSIEFHDLMLSAKTVMRDVAERGTMYDFGTMSCEQIADTMARRLANAHQGVVGVSISEDGECGALVYAEPEFERDDDGAVPAALSLD